METQLHYLKTHQEMYLETELGNKLFEIRKNDRDFRVRDYLCLQETREINGEYTENEMVVSVSFILANDRAVRYGLQEGYCAMSLVKLLPQTQVTIKKQTYRWDEKLAILFSRQDGIRVVNELTRDWVKHDWEETIENTNLTVDQFKVNLIRRAETWYDEENTKETGMSIFEQKFEFEKWLGW